VDALRHWLGAAALQERTKLGRDLHDGVLQGLAAASIQLKILSLSLPPEAQEQLQTIRQTLADEAQRIRSFVEANRARAIPTTGHVQITADIEKRVARLRDLWACEINVSIEPADLTSSITTARHIGHMLAEAVSNAVRHGRATFISIAIEKRGDNVVLSVSDNGSGFVGLQGTFTSAELNRTRSGPLSLKSRVTEAGGRLFLTSLPSGTNVTVELPQ
jgi:signal transduction histidine kinase